MKRVVKPSGVILACILVLGLTFATFQQTALAAEKVIKWKLQAVYPLASPSYKAGVLRVIKKIKERTNGRLIIEPFVAGSLVPSKEIFNAVERGMIPAGVTSPAYSINKIPVMAFASTMPFNFTEVWQGQYFHKWVGFEKILQDAALKYGVYYFSDRVYPTEMVAKEPITKLADFKGRKIRSAGKLAVFLTKLGAASSYITGGEIYTAMASGVVDGGHWGAAQGALKMGFYELCKYHLKPCLNLGAPDAWVFNKKRFDALPKDIQATVRDILEDHFWYRSNEYIYLEQQALNEGKNKLGVKVTTITPEEQIKIRKIAQEQIWLEASKKDAACEQAYKMMIDYMKKLDLL
jgi:TRAP-type mannitol/chloroaromatic compound transport system substrate-binding protein